MNFFKQFRNLAEFSRPWPKVFAKPWPRPRPSPVLLFSVSFYDRFEALAHT